MTEKEIGIEKLIRYLLESKGDEYKDEYYEWYRDVELEQNIDSLSELRLFVKWLVENDKINTESGPLYGFHFIMHNRQPYSLYETILMILAISDTPIEDLISYLK